MFAHAGVDTLVVLLGLNDIGFSETDEQPTYRPAPRRGGGRTRRGAPGVDTAGPGAGVRVVGATLLPFGGSDHWGERAAKVSHEVNEWIRCSGEYDAVVDLHRALADPGAPDVLCGAYDFGDHLHPNDRRVRR